MTFLPLGGMMLAMRKGVLIIFAETHKIIARKVNKTIEERYNIKLNERKLLWGSVAPDIIPKYRLYRHYQAESLDFVVNEIIGLIYITRFFDSSYLFESISKSVFSRKLGVISHYLSDYCCQPHFERWTFDDNMIKHVTYEKRLNTLAMAHDFEEQPLQCSLEAEAFDVVSLRHALTAFIEGAVEQYAAEPGAGKDLDFAMSLNVAVFSFVIDTVHALSMEKEPVFALQI